MADGGWGRPVRPGPPAVRVEALGDALLLRAGTGPAGALRAVTSALGRGHRETVVVTAPAVTGQDGLFDLVIDAVAEAAPIRAGIRTEIRLVLLGAGPDRDTREDGIRRVAWRLGRRVTGSLGPVVVASDGTCVSVPHGAHGDAPDGDGWRYGWYGSDGTGPDGDSWEPPWSPEPRWPVLPAPESRTRDQAGPGLVAHPVPAGLWLLPAGVRPGQAGVVGSLPREPDAPTIFVGGCGRPVAADEVARAVAAMRPDPASRLVLLPRAVPDGAPADRFDGLPVRVRSAVPVLGETGWRLAPVTTAGTVVPPAAAEAPAGDDRPASPAVAPARSGPYTEGRRPVPGRATAAGWSLLDDTDALGIAPAAAGVLVEVATGPQGFLVGGAPISVADFADLLAAALGPGPASLVLAGPDHDRPVTLLAELAEVLGAPVYAPAGPLALTATGVLLAASGFHAYVPGAPPEPAGPVLPAGCADARMAGLATRFAPIAPAGPGRSRSVPARAGIAGVTRRPGDAPASAVRTAARAAEPRPEPRPEATELQDALVAALGPEYDRHAAELDEPTPELVALRAYANGAGPGVNAYLRGAPIPEPGAATGPWGPPAVVAAGALLAFRQLPVVFGPVFASSAAPAGSYAAGVDLTEPGFVEAHLGPGAHPDARTEYAIWSMTARRVDAAVRAGAPVACFAPGSRFAVLAVERFDGRIRVYLADRNAGPTADAGTLLARLRAGAAAPSTDRPMIAPIGLTDSGRPFAYDP
ncbi:hypothetical protein [Dactylosporangium sucinum]|uniref:hypothetical protein n=1 Tax=Dactylosporangium sucinum TaxID=1424081 RepID=UPI0036D3BD69